MDSTEVRNEHKPKVIGDFGGKGQADVAVVTTGKWVVSLPPAGEGTHR